MPGELSWAYDVQAALHRLGLEVEERDGEGWRRCPGHYGRTGREDASPSWSINLETGLHHCFSCGYGGSLPHLVSGMLRVSYPEAEAWLASPELLASLVQARMRTTARRLGLGGVIDLSRFTLPPAPALATRNISMEAAIRYEIMWDGRQFILPIRDAEHQLLGYQIKRGPYVRNRPIGVPKAQCLYGLGAFTGETAVLVESPLDCARLWSAGIDGALATFGASVSVAQIEMLVHFARRLVLALDDDEPGRRGAEEVEKIVNHRIPVTRFAYPRPCGKDPGELDETELYIGMAEASSRLELLAPKDRA